MNAHPNSNNLRPRPRSLHDSSSHARRWHRSCRRLWVAVFFWAGLISGSAQDDGQWTQSVNLTAGWNSVWLEVDSLDAEGNPRGPEDVFSDAAVTVVAAFFPGHGPVEFLEDPDENSFDEDHWKVWYRDDPSGRNSLGAVAGHRAYLVKADNPAALEISGNATFHQYSWVSDSYNLTGFGILAGNPPSFKDFFAPAAQAHPVGQVFKLAGGNWVTVDPTESMQLGVAYWIYASGHSSYQGPLLVDFKGVDNLDYGTSIRDQEVLFFNESVNPITVQVERIHPANDFHLAHVIRDPVALTNVEDVVISTFLIGPIPGRQSMVETFRAKRDWGGVAEKSQLYRVSSEETGSYVWLPAVAVKEELLMVEGDTNPLTTSRGLWVGDVILGAVSYRQPLDLEDTSPSAHEPVLQPALAVPKARVILHVNDAGMVSLVKAVTLMRQRTVTPEEASQVLVVDMDKIPFFEGIETRGGKLVGKRIETAFYDLPRISPMPRPLTEDFEQSLLVEEYYKALPLQGALGPGKKCMTAPGSVDKEEEYVPGSLEMDEYHRTNPFRHAFHPSHTAGFRVVRDMKFVFDPPDTESARDIPDYGTKVLQGTFNETLKGLLSTTNNIIVAGRFVVRRVSTVGTLE